MSKISANIIRLVLICVISFGSSQVIASGLPFLAHLADGRDLPKPFGVSLDVLSLNQDYEIEQFNLDVPFFESIDSSLVEIESDTDYTAIKFDAWLFPFLNVFFMAGDIEGSTFVTLDSVQVPNVPIAINNINIDVDGEVYGAWLTGVGGGDKWFSSLTVSYTESDLDGEFSSGIDTWTVMPRAGARFKQFDVWLSAMYLELDETHTGTIDLNLVTPFGPLPPVNFDLSLRPEQSVNYGLGARFKFNKSLNAAVEFTFGDREHQFFNLNWRF